MEQLPFGDRTVASLVSCTTIHELAMPVPCVEEMVRVLAPGGVLVVADFNDIGFAALDRVHRKLNRRDHTRGLLPMAEVAALLARRSLSVREVHTPLLAACIATGTRIDERHDGAARGPEPAPCASGVAEVCLRLLDLTVTPALSCGGAAVGATTPPVGSVGAACPPPCWCGASCSPTRTPTASSTRTVPRVTRSASSAPSHRLSRPPSLGSRAGLPGADVNTANN